MASEYDVHAAWLEIMRDDTGPGGLVTLMGKAEPGCEWGTPDAADLPVIPVPIPVSSPSPQATGPIDIQTWRPEARTGRGDANYKLACQMLDRLKVITTWQAFDDLGFDIRVEPGTRAPEDPGDSGGYRLVQDYRLHVSV